MTSSIHVPAEWVQRKALFTAWPSAADLWEDDLIPARAEVAAMVTTLALHGEVITIFADGDEAVASARAALGHAATVVDRPFGDIWFRDTGPIFCTRDGAPHAQRFWFNGWGGKYVLDGDEQVPDAIGALAGVPVTENRFVLEGGAIDLDGEGTLLTTRQCLLNGNRNSGWNEASAGVALKQALGVQKILWLDEGLVGDHTDGHVDNIARFVAPGRVVCQAPSGSDDPNTAILDSIADQLSMMTDARGRPLEVIRIPSPGRILDEDDEPVPASHMNFLIGAGAVVVPVYEDVFGPQAVAALTPLFPDRKVIGLKSKAILTGGGSFHCITQQQPA